MLKRFECKIGSGWTGFLNVLDDAIAQAWREDRWTDYFKDEFYFRPSADEVAPEIYHRLRAPLWYGNHPNTESKAWFTENGYTRFQDDIERILKVYEAAGIPTRCLQSECPCGKLVSHGTYQRIYAVENKEEQKIMKITLNEQECTGTYDFCKAGTYVATVGFANTFGDNATKVFTDAVNLVHEKYGDKADYLQTFVCELGEAKEEKIRFWLILDEYSKNNLRVTALLPEEY